MPESSADYVKSLSSVEPSYLIACDGGADILARNNIIPDILIGDMDSISDEAMDFMVSNGVPVEKYPVEKDWTDTEIALKKTEGGDVFLVCPLAGRIDHVIANLQLIASPDMRGKVIATDGMSFCYPLKGADSVKVDLKPFEGPVSVSLIPMDFSCAVTGVTTEGLYYPLENHDLKAGPSFSFSNHPVDGADSFSVAVKSGILLVTVTPEV